VVNLVLLWLLHVAPGWKWLTFLTDEFANLVGLITASLVVGAVIDLVYVVGDPPWMKRLGDAITATFACVIFARAWAVFPFDLDGWWSGWVTLLRLALGFLTVATAIAVVASLAELIRLGSDADRATPRPPADSIAERVHVRTPPAAPTEEGHDAHDLRTPSREGP
jgi:hypothetical protein